MLYVIAYIWLIHIPMSIQSRYTVPVHAITLACIAWPLQRAVRADEATCGPRNLLHSLAPVAASPNPAAYLCPPKNTQQIHP